jgi:hypothetical protein
MDILRLNLAWDKIRRFGNQKIVQLTILVPILGYFVLFGDWYTTNYEVLGEIPKWKVFVLYYGLTFIAIASILYNKYCPSEIQSHGTSREYIASETMISNNLTDAKLRSDLWNVLRADLKRNLPTAVLQYRNTLLGMQGGGQVIPDNINLENFEGLDLPDSTLSTAANTANFGNSRQEFYYAYYDILLYTAERVRVCTAFFYKLGFFLVAIPSCWTFLEVVRISVLAFITYWSA